MFIGKNVYRKNLWARWRTVVFFEPIDGVVDEDFVDTLDECWVVDVARGGVSELAAQ